MFYFVGFQLIGGAIFGFSLWLLVDFFINEYQAATEDLKESRYVVYVFVAASAFMVVYSLIGIIGAIKPSWKCLLIIVSQPSTMSCLIHTIIPFTGKIAMYEIYVKHSLILLNSHENFHMIFTGGDFRLCMLVFQFISEFLDIHVCIIYNTGYFTWIYLFVCMNFFNIDFCIVFY